MEGKSFCYRVWGLTDLKIQRHGAYMQRIICTNLLPIGIDEPLWGSVSYMAMPNICFRFWHKSTDQDSILHTDQSCRKAQQFGYWLSLSKHLAGLISLPLQGLLICILSCLLFRLMYRLILETDAATIAQRVTMKGAEGDVPLSEQVSRSVSVSCISVGLFEDPCLLLKPFLRMGRMRQRYLAINRYQKEMCGNCRADTPPI